MLDGLAINRKTTKSQFYSRYSCSNTMAWLQIHIPTEEYGVFKLILVPPTPFFTQNCSISYGFGGFQGQVVYQMQML